MTNALNTQSAARKKNAAAIDMRITMTVVITVSLRVGQVTFLSSILTSLKNWVVLVNRLSLGLPASGPAHDAGFFFSLLTTAAPAEAFFSPWPWTCLTRPSGC